MTEESSSNLQFSVLNADQGVTEVESLCMSCHENGTTRILLTKIPFFKEVILMSFSCPHCGFRSTDVQHGGSIAPKGSKFELKVKTPEDANRTVVKSSYATVYLPELDLEIPSTSQKGSLTTAEGILSRVSEDLKRDLPLRRAVAPEQADQIEQFLPKVDALLENHNYTILLTDPSGNSFIQPLNYPDPDHNLEISHYYRSREETSELGLVPEEVGPDKETNIKDQYQAIIRDAHIAEKFKERLGDPEEVYVLPVHCYLCQAEGELKCFECEIPYFKKIVLMAFTCENCGYKNTEVKASGDVEPKGKIHTLKVRNELDLKRDFLKSEYASVDVPEAALHVTTGTLGGFFTTVEGMVTKCRDQLESANPFYIGDSATVGDRDKFKEFLRKLDRLATLEEEFTIILNDPVGNSYIQATSDNIDEDENLTVEEYDRTEEMDVELGLMPC
ncbi:hypothetical protein GEMRC1_006960 [Eukaryota sp. GEM-RC1]